MTQTKQNKNAIELLEEFGDEIVAEIESAWQNAEAQREQLKYGGLQ